MYEVYVYISDDHKYLALRSLRYSSYIIDTTSGSILSVEFEDDTFYFNLNCISLAI